MKQWQAMVAGSVVGFSTFVAIVYHIHSMEKPSLSVSYFVSLVGVFFLGWYFSNRCSKNTISREKSK